MKKRVVLIVLDSAGVGALPDAADYGDSGAATIAHILEKMPELSLVNLARLGLYNIDGMFGRPPATYPEGVYCRCLEKSKGKDSIIGHWELMGVITDRPFLTFGHGFPPEIIDAFQKLIGREILANETGSGTEMIAKYGDEHVKTEKPIVYTSADSVFQIAAHEEVVPLDELYRWCSLARKMFDEKWGIGRVIARPFIGSSGSYTRTANRHDYAALPGSETVLERLKKHEIPVFSVGKPKDIFSGIGITKSVTTQNNTDGIEKTIEAVQSMEHGLVFTNLIDYDMLYGHRRDVSGYAAALSEFDRALPRIMEQLGPEDLLILTADHGCDPTYKGSDHTREFIPALIWRPGIVPENRGTRESFSDVGATVLKAFDIHHADMGTPII